jgi:hypothetical protein
MHIGQTVQNVQYSNSTGTALLGAIQRPMNVCRLVLKISNSVHYLEKQLNSLIACELETGGVFAAILLIEDDIRASSFHNP